jgi:hypothetical protein
MVVPSLHFLRGSFLPIGSVRPLLMWKDVLDEEGEVVFGVMVLLTA